MQSLGPNENASIIYFIAIVRHFNLLFWLVDFQISESHFICSLLKCYRLNRPLHCHIRRWFVIRWHRMCSPICQYSSVAVSTARQTKRKREKKTKRKQKPIRIRLQSVNWMWWSGSLTVILFLVRSPHSHGLILSPSVRFTCSSLNKFTL